MDPQVCTELKYQFLKITRNIQSSFRIGFSGLVAYIDPFKIQEENHDADYIFITHEHPDHFDPISIQNIKKENSVFITNQTVASQLLDQNLTSKNNLVILKPEDYLDLDKYISISTKHAYNLNKFKEPNLLYHPKESGGLGFVISFLNDHDNVTIYHMGDTDFLENEHRVEDLDILLIPVGGTYVMTPEEAIIANNHIQPQISVPMHYDSRLPNLEFANKFINSINNQGVIL